MLARHSKPNCKVSEAFGENVNKMNNQGLITLVFFLILELNKKKQTMLHKTDIRYPQTIHTVQMANENVERHSTSLTIK